MEKNVGGHDCIARAVPEPMFIAVEAVSLAGFLTIVADAFGLVIAVAALLVGAVLATATVTQKCPPNDLLGADTYEDAMATETESVGRPRTQQAFLRLVTRTRPDRRVHETGG